MATLFVIQYKPPNRPSVSKPAIWPVNKFRYKLSGYSESERRNRGWTTERHSLL